MDQVKVYLAVAKKYHFWILIALVVITGVAVWYSASSKLKSKYEADKQTITTAQDSVQKAMNPEPVNPLFTSKVDKLHDGLKTAVFDAWKKLYDRQVVWFRWPDFSEYDANVDLGKFLPSEDIPEYVRVIFNEKIVRDQWKELFEKVHLRTVKAKDPSEDVSTDPDEQSRGVEYEGLVVWAPDKRDAISNRYYTVNSAPSTTRLRLAQEDYWLFESLIEVINTVNAGAGDTLKAPIKEIQMMDVAQWAIAASQEDGGTIWTKESRGATGAGAMGMGGPAGMSADAGAMQAAAGAGGAAGAPGAAGDAAAGSKEDDTVWQENRYLDDKGQPLAAGAAQPFAEFKQVFVYMKLIMDQRRIPELVAACANAHLPIETRQIRVRMIKGDSGNSGFFPGAPGGGGFGGMPMAGGAMPGMMPGGAMPGMMPGGGAGPMGMGGGGPGMMGADPGAMAGYTPPGAPGGADGYGAPGGMGTGMGGMGGFGFGPSGLDGQGGGVETTVYDWLVELSGVIYLYNPAELDKLGTGAVGAPEQRSFGVPKKPVRPPRSSGMGGGGGYMGAMGPMGAG